MNKAGYGKNRSSLLPSENIRFNKYGGLMVKMIAGEKLYEGEIVCILQAGDDDKVYKCPVSGNEQDMPIGVVFATVEANKTVWVVVSGKAYVLPTASETAARGNVICASSITAGRVDQYTTTGAAQHWREVGHWTKNGTGAGVKTMAIVHFN